MANDNAGLNKPQPREEPAVPDHVAGPPGWVAVTGAAFAGVTLIFFMVLVVVSVLAYHVPPNSRFLVLVVLALGAAMSVAFLGGAAAAQGSIPIPGAEKNALTISTTGGIAVLLIVLLLGYYLYVSPANQFANNYVILPVQSEIPKEFTIENKSPETISDVGEVRTNGGKRYLYVEFRSGADSGTIQLTYLNDYGVEFQRPVFDVTINGRLTRKVDE